MRTRVGQVLREVEHLLDLLPEAVRDKARDLLGRTNRLIIQSTKDENKLYAVHAPKVECIFKGKACTSYLFGVKLSIATTLKEGLVVGLRAMPGNPYDGHTLDEMLEQVGILTGMERPPSLAILDKGYRGGGGPRGAHSDFRAAARDHQDA